MSTVPPEIPGIGSTGQKLRVAAGFDAIKAGVGPEEYFVLSRVDGSTTLRDVLLTTGLPVDRAVSIVIKLRTLGALLLPGESSGPRPAAGTGPAARMTSVTMTPQGGAPVVGRGPGGPATNAPPVTSGAAGRPASAPPTGRTTTAPPSTAASSPTRRTTTPPVTARTTPPPVTVRTTAPPPSAPAVDPTATAAELSLPSPTAEERAALAEDVELDEAERRRILALTRRYATGDSWGLLGVPQGSDAQALKRAYFRLSKDIHPDRYYGKRLGSFAARTATVFEAVSRAYAALSGRERGRGAGQAGGPGTSDRPAGHEQPQTPQEYAAELFERACGLEVAGDVEGAMKLFAAAVRVDGQLRYLRRATSCALTAQQPKTALEYAKKVQALSPSDPSSARLLAAAFRAAGKLVEAEEVLVMAMALKSENDTLTAELRYDLADVRRLLG